jgi:hypothetical protein
MKNRVDNYLKLAVWKSPERLGAGESAIPKARGTMRTHEIFPFNSASDDFEKTARQALDLLFAEVAEAKREGLSASLSAFDPRPFARFLRNGERLPRIGDMRAQWGLS